MYQELNFVSIQIPLISIFIQSGSLHGVQKFVPLISWAKPFDQNSC